MANINEKIILQDQASATLKKVANEANKTSATFDKMQKNMSFKDPKISKGFSDLGSKFDGLKNKFSAEFPKFAQSFNGFGGIIGDIAKINPVITASVAAIGVYAAAMKGYFALTNEYINEFGNKFSEEGGLALASLNRRGTGNVSDIIKTTEAVESRGVVGAGELQVGATKLLRAGNIKEAETFSAIMADMAASQKMFNATGADTEKAAMAINKAMNGQIKGLQEYGVYVDGDTKKRFQAMNETQRSAFIYDQLNKAVGGTNERLKDTSLGVIKSSSFMFDGLKEQVGSWAVGGMAQIHMVFQKYEPLFKRVADVFGKGLSIAGSVLAGITDALLGFGEAIWEIGAAIITPITKYFGEIGKILGLGDGLTQQFSYVFRVIGINISYFGKMIGGIASMVGDGLNLIVDSIIYSWYSSIEQMNKILPKAITDKFDFFKDASKNKDIVKNRIQEMNDKSYLGNIQDGFYQYVNEIMKAKETAGVQESSNPFEAFFRDIVKNTKDTADNTRKMGEIDEEYLNNVRDYFVTRNTWNSQNSQIDNRTYNLNMSGKKVNMEDPSNDIDDLVGMGY